MRSWDVGEAGVGGDASIQCEPPPPRICSNWPLFLSMLIKHAVGLASRGKFRIDLNLELYGAFSMVNDFYCVVSCQE